MNGLSWVNEDKVVFTNENSDSLIIGDLSNQSGQVLLDTKEYHSIVGEIKTSEDNLYVYYGQTNKISPNDIAINKIELSTKTIISNGTKIKYKPKGNPSEFVFVKYNIAKNGEVTAEAPLNQ